jgi:hypothetical protein
VHGGGLARAEDRADDGDAQQARNLGADLFVAGVEGLAAASR